MEFRDRKKLRKDSTTEDYGRKRSNPRETEIPEYIPAMNYKLQATTTKENDDKLSQKIENIEETTHSEASSSKVEGFNIAQNVLTDRYVNFSNTTNTKSTSDINESMDEIAKKCMDRPANQIDHKLIKEIEKFGIAHSDEHKSKLNEEVVQMGSVRNPDKPLHEVEIDFEKRKDKKEPIHCAEEDKLEHSFEMAPQLDQNVVSTEDQADSTSYNKIQMSQESEIFEENVQENTSMIFDSANLNEKINLFDPKLQYDLNQPIIDPYDKKTLAFDNDEVDEAVMESKLLDDQRIGKPSENEEDEALAEAYVARSSEAIPKEQEYREPVMVEDRSHIDYVQSVYDCEPKEINWRPYPSFEAREEVMDFYTQEDVGFDSFKLTHTETITHKPSESEPAVEKSHEPQPEHIYTSTSVSSEPREQISHSFVQPEEMINPLMEKTIDEPKEIVEQPQNIEKSLADTFETLPSLNPDGNVSLSELLRRVRMRNRMEYCREFAVHTINAHVPEALPAEGKCGKKTPPCPPPPPKCPPPNPCPPPPPACPPPPPPCPKPCKPASKRPCPPPKKNPCKRFNGSSVREVLTLLTQNNPQVKIPQKYLLPILAYNAIRTPARTESEEDILLHENLVFRLSVLGKILLFHCTEAIDANLPRNRSELSFARSFEPWTPIPSWPITKKEEKKRFVCPKEGCKMLPPPKLNAPCKENPCLNFPKRSNFSLTDLFSFSLVESLVCHTV
ncbi:hypothetical protein O3G_MSEX011248 [Manduca sexta]|uniref:Uncharacterized protein n=1 Tax=Manduca sexta TaxID=7130 RepID=A0A921ZJJ9_MANSE|nr:hypothetical protein O3G_MSEX011248 [Manduca sexta]